MCNGRVNRSGSCAMGFSIEGNPAKVRVTPTHATAAGPVAGSSPSTPESSCDGTLVECVPNFSEGRNLCVVEDLGKALQGAGVTLLDRHVDGDHNRTVYTIVGSMRSVEAAVLSAARVAVQRIDIRGHRGTHPRVGAIDVVPAVPLERGSEDACVEAVRSMGERLWLDLRIPVYFYGAAACAAGRITLESVRKLGFERLSRRVLQGFVKPDLGEGTLHPSAGACCLGVRPPMVAFNVQLAASDDRAARMIATAVRESNGGLGGVKALGMYLATAGVAQVSMNLTKLNETPVFKVFESVCRYAADLGVRVVDSELVGLVPRSALGCDPEQLRIRGFHEGMILERRLQQEGMLPRGSSPPGY